MKKNILVIEDEEIIAQMVKDVLESRGFKVMLAFSGMEGLNKAEMHMPDLIALDIMMPGLDGINVLKRLKSNEKTKNIPTLILSIAEGYKDEGLKLGAAGFLKKPFDFNVLVNKIKECTDKKTVLVLDDNETTLKIIELRLSIAGYNVICVEDENSLYKKLEEEKPDMILTDIVLSDSDGLRIIRKLKSHKDYSDIPVITFSGYISDEIPDNKIAGVENHISGKFNIDKLCEEIKHSIDSKILV